MQIRLIITLFLLLFVMVFAVQNAATVEIKLLFWEVSFARSFLIIMMLLIGVIVGWFSRAIFRITKTTNKA